MPNPFQRSRWYHKISNMTSARMFRVQAMPRGFVLLTVTGRKTGKRYYRPIRAVRIGDTFYASAILGEGSDWLRNVRKNPQVSLKHGRKTVPATAREVTDAAEAERATKEYVESVYPFDRIDYPIVDWWLPTRGAIVKAHRDWLERGKLVALDVGEGA